MTESYINYYRKANLMNQQNLDFFAPRPYTRVSKEKQKKLIYLVIEKEWKIKKAALKLEINYAAAKSIVFKFKKDSFQKFYEHSFCLKRCQYKPIGENYKKFKVISVSRGQIIS